MRYVVLRDMQRIRQAGEPGSPARTFGVERSEVTAPPIPRIDVEAADARGRGELAREPDVRAVAAVMPTRLVEPLGSLVTCDGASSWGVAAVGADASSWTGEGTVTAVLDTGIDAAHDAFAGVTLVEEDFSGDGNGDRHGHGTHCAGTVFGRDVGGMRIGVARGVRRPLVGKILADDGTGTSDMIFRGLSWAVGQGAHVISMSVGLDFPGMAAGYVAAGWPADLATSAALEAYRGNLRMLDALMAMFRTQEAFGPGCVVVAAAGNESRRDVNPDYEIAASLPAAAEGVISVGAVSRSPGGYALAPFSNAFPAVCAPGVDIISARAGGGIRAMSGTSMACPHAAGVAALWWEAILAGGLPPAARLVVARILATCRTGSLASGLTAAARGSGLVSAP